MKTVDVAEPGTDFLSLIEEIQNTRESVEITRQGKRVALLSPMVHEEIDWTPGGCAETVTYVGDVVSPVFDMKDLDLESQWF